jgi:hypothetical protein
LNKIQFVIAFILEQSDEMLMLSARKEEKKTEKCHTSFSVLQLHFSLV